VIEKIQNIFRIKELRHRILFTLALLVVYRIGGHIPAPGIDASLLSRFFAEQGGGGLFGMFDMFVGGAFKKASVFSLGIMPYISASIIIQLLTPIFPYFQKLAKEGEEDYAVHSLRNGVDFDAAGFRCSRLVAVTATGAGSFDCDFSGGRFHVVVHDHVHLWHDLHHVAR
jgi:hypothetical protein